MLSPIILNLAAMLAAFPWTPPVACPPAPTVRILPVTGPANVQPYVPPIKPPAEHQ